MAARTDAQADVWSAPVPTRPSISAGGLVARIVVIGLLVALVIGLPLSGSPDLQHHVTLAAIFAIVGISMNILVGYAGQISLGQQGFVGMGALVAANLVNTELNAADPFTFGLCLAAAVGLGAATAFVLGIVALRISGLYLALVTLVFGVVVADSVFSIEALNGHSTGVRAIRPEALADEGHFYLFCLAFVAVMVYIDWSFTRTKAGRAANALRENELAAQAFATGLVDECHLFLAPVVVGGGTRSLPDGVHLGLVLLDERRFGNGMVYLRYRATPRSP